MTRILPTTTAALLGALMLLPSGGARAEPLAPTGGAGNTGVTAPAGTGGVGSGARELGPGPVTGGNAADRSNSPVPGTTPDVTIGGTPTAGPPGTGGPAGGPGFGNQ